MCARINCKQTQKACCKLTEIGRIVVAGTRQPQVGHKRNELLDGALVDAVSAGDRVQPIEHLEQQRTWLMDGADDRAAFLGEPLQQRYAAGGRRTVQAAA